MIQPMPKEVEEALAQRDVAFNAFDNAEPSHIDLAIEQLNIALARVDFMYRKYKLSSPFPSSLPEREEGKGFT